MRWIVSRSLRFRWLVLFAGAAMMVFGVAQIPNAKVDVFPEFAPPQVEIQTIALGNSSTEVEELITVPMEEQLNGIEGIAELRSKSVSQLSSIRLIFKDNMDELRARQLVTERVSQIAPTLPTWAAPPTIMPPLSATSRIMKIGLTSNELNPMEMSALAYWKVRQRILRVPGVAQVNIFGERLDQRHVQVDPAKLAKNGVSLERVMTTTSEALDSGVLQYADSFLVGTGGFVEAGGQRLNVRNVQPIQSAEDLGKVPVTRRNGKVLRLSDLGLVKRDYQPIWGEGVINDKPGLMLIVQKFRGANTMEVTDGIEDAMKEMQPGLPSITADTTIFRPATFIEQSIDNLTKALLIGILLVILIIVAFLFEWRTAFISLIAIPLSLIAAMITLDLTGSTLNVMVLAGLVISIGVVVDDAIIGVENIVRRLRQRDADTSVSVARTVLDATIEVRSAITYATLIVLVAVIPVLFLEGLSGAFFRPLVFSYGLAVLVSMVVAITVTPAMCLLMLRKGQFRRTESPLLRVLKRGYGAVLARVIRRPSPAIMTAAVCILAGLLIYPTLGNQLLPNFKERDFLMHWLTQPGTSAPEETRISVRACKDLREIPGVRNCGSHIGQALMGDEVYGVDFGENWISVDKSVDYDDTLAKVQRTVEGYPGIYRDVQTYLRERIKEVLTGTSEAIVVRVFGPDLEVLRDKSEEISERIGKVDGVIDAHPSFSEDLPHIEIELNLAAAQRHGLKPGDVRRQSSTLLAGEEVSDIFYGGRAYDVQVWSIPSARDSVTDVVNLPIETPSGERVRLEQVADVRLAPTPNKIERTQQSRRIDVGANVGEGHDLESVVSDVEKQLEGVKFPPGVHAEVLGESTELNAAQDKLNTYGIAAAIAIFLLLQAAFGSLRLAALTFLLLPMALVGGILAVWLGDGVMSLGSLVGFLTIFGIAARNGILMISHFQHLEREEGVPFGPALVLRGAKERLAPIMMTALACGLALVPLAVAGSLPGHEIEHPMAVVILGGLVTSTMLNLFVLPSLYLRFAKSRKERRRLEATPASA